MIVHFFIVYEINKTVYKNISGRHCSFFFFSKACIIGARAAGLVGLAWLITRDFQPRNNPPGRLCVK